MICLVVLCLVLTTLLSSCGNDQTVLQEGWDPKEPDYKNRFSFDSERKWLLVRDSYREGVVLLEYELLEPDNPLRLIVTILPVSFSNDALIAEMRRMLELSLHNHTHVSQMEKKYISEHLVFSLAAEAGLDNNIYACSSGFNYKGRAYMMTILATGETKIQANEEMEQIISSFKLN
jgi:hypothetical protein